MYIAWRIKIHHIAHAIAISSNQVFAVVNHSKLLCINSQTGEEYWRTNVVNPWGCLALNNQTVFYLNQHHFLMAFDRGSGQLIWSKKLPGIFGWLHASDNKVVLGGWRSYTDLFCFNAITGKLCWTFATQNNNLNRTFISENQLNVGLAVNNRSEIIILELATGQITKKLKLEGIWNQNNFDYIPISNTGAWKSIDRYLIFQCTKTSFYRIDSNSLNVEYFEINKEISVQNLEEHLDLIPFISQGNSLSIFNIKTNTSWRLGMIQHNRQDKLPIFIQNESNIVVGTSFGLIHHFVNSCKNSTMKVGKRVSTSLGWSNNYLCFGTASGEIMGVSLE